MIRFTRSNCEAQGAKWLPIVPLKQPNHPDLASLEVGDFTRTSKNRPLLIKFLVEKGTPTGPRDMSGLGPFHVFAGASVHFDSLASLDE